MSISTPQKRKSPTLEKKMEIYEFEVDENEPKAKQKKKRGPKPGTKNKFKWGNIVKGSLKNPSKIVKKVQLVKNPAASLLQNENQNRILSTKSSSSPLFENKRRPLMEGNSISVSKIVLPGTEKENLICQTSEETCDRKLRRKRRSSNDKKKKIKSKDNENASPQLVHEENSTHQTSEFPLNSNRRSKRFSSVKKSCLSCNKISNHNNDKHISPVRLQEKHNKTYETLEVPVLFHNHQDATPSKKSTSLTSEKPAYTAISDDENLNSSYRENSVLHNFFTASVQASGEKSKVSSRSSLYHDGSYDCHINASTPVKYNDNCSGGSVQNCFGFDELEQFEEPLVSPIKISEASGSSHSGVSQITPYKSQPKQNSTEIKKEIPVKQVIKMLKYGSEIEENNLETRSKSSSSNSPSPIFNDPSPVEEKQETIVKPVARRSYERPSYLRKINKSFEENSDEDKHEETVKPLIPKKKHHGQTKKEQDEMQKWIKEFNSQCQEIENFDLLVE